MKRIPKSFQLMNHTIEVVVIPAKEWPHAGEWANWDHDKLKIEVCAGKQSVVSHKFWHEVTHALFEMAGRNDLSRQEALVDTIGALLAQMMRTAA